MKSDQTFNAGTFCVIVAVVVVVDVVTVVVVDVVAVVVFVVVDVVDVVLRQLRQLCLFRGMHSLPFRTKKGMTHFCVAHLSWAKK